MRRTSILLAVVLLVCGLITMATTNAEAAFCDSRVSKDRFSKINNVASFYERSVGTNNWRKVVVTARVRYNKCFTAGGRHRFDNVTSVSVSYKLWRKDGNFVKPQGGPWQRVRNVNCSGKRNFDWFEGVNVHWYESGLGGWNPPDYLVDCQRDGAKTEGRRPPGGIKRVPASNHAHWIAWVEVRRHAFHYNYRERLHNEVR